MNSSSNSDGELEIDFQVNNETNLIQKVEESPPTRDCLVDAASKNQSLNDVKDTSASQEFENGNIHKPFCQEERNIFKESEFDNRRISEPMFHSTDASISFAGKFKKATDSNQDKELPISNFSNNCDTSQMHCESFEAEKSFSLLSLCKDKDFQQKEQSVETFKTDHDLQNPWVSRLQETDRKPTVNTTDQVFVNSVFVVC